METAMARHAQHQHKSAKPITSRARVRSGCQTCRDRKVKCDEKKPVCYNCRRLNRVCMYRDSARRMNLQIQNEDVSSPNTNGSEEMSPFSHQTPPLVEPFFNAVFPDTESLPPTSLDPANENLFSNGHHVPSSFSITPYSFPGANLDISLATEWRESQSYNNDFADLNTYELPLVNSLSSPDISDTSLFPYFLQYVELPFISRFDPVNWARVKAHVVELGGRNATIAATISAVSALYKAMTNGEETTDAASLYYAAKSSHAKMLNEAEQDLPTTLLTTFLLCCFEVVAQQETVSITLNSEGAFVKKLEKSVIRRPWPQLACRIEAWLRILHAKALHLGGRGLLGARVGQLLHTDTALTAGVHFPRQTLDPLLIIRESMCSPLFEFYLATQKISTRITGLNRHHRPRETPTDTLEVNQAVDEIKRELHILWQERPSLLRTECRELRSHLSSEITLELSKLASICITAYFVEIVYLGRSHGQSLTPTSEAQDAMQQIRRMVDNTSPVSNDQNIDSGFLWPLLIYALETTEHDGPDWAVRRMKEILDPICHGDFFADLADALSQEQRRTGKRVDTRFFCIERFGIPPPFV